jgi:hypothetical protein
VGVVFTVEVSAVVGSTAEVSAVAVSMVVGSTGEPSAVALSTAVPVSVGDVSPVAVSVAVAFVVAVLVGAITDSLMMSSSAASAFRGGGAGAIRTDITVTTITRTITMDTADTVTTVAPVMDIAMEAERVTDTAMAADQGIPGVRGVGDKPGYVSLKIRDETTCEFSKSGRPMFGDKFGE